MLAPVSQVPQRFRLGKPVPRMPSVASEGCLAEAHRAKAGRCRVTARVAIVAGQPLPPKNIENNPMQSSRMIDTSSREYNLTCRANQPHHGNLAQSVGRIGPARVIVTTDSGPKRASTSSPRPRLHHRLRARSGGLGSHRTRKTPSTPRCNPAFYAAPRSGIRALNRNSAAPGTSPGARC